MLVRVGAFFSEGYVLWCSQLFVHIPFYKQYLDLDIHLGSIDHLHRPLLSRTLDVRESVDLFSWALKCFFSIHYSS